MGTPGTAANPCRPGTRGQARLHGDGSRLGRRLDEFDPAVLGAPNPEHCRPSYSPYHGLLLPPLHLGRHRHLDPDLFCLLTKGFVKDYC